MTSQSPAQSSSRQSLRHTLRAKRRALSPAQQRRAAETLAEKLSQHLWFRKAKHIAFYLPSDGEIDPSALIDIARALGKQCYLPVILPNHKMQFRGLTKLTQFAVNRFGIIEPRQCSHFRPTWLIDLILLPLVGFDLQGNRLGMGGGYYDRALAPNPSQPRVSRYRIGLAHSCQQVSEIEHAHWDMPLAAIATEQGVRLLRN